MLSIIPKLDETVGQPLYRQLFRHIRQAILDGHINAGEKLPSLRVLAHQLNLSVTTIKQAYEQLAVEGYTENRPRSGYFVNPIGLGGRPAEAPPPGATFRPFPAEPAPVNTPYTDPANFDFIKWRKCYLQILTDETAQLLREGDPEGEPALRRQIARYAYQARGVLSDWRQIVIGAGTQQLINLLCLILRQRRIDLVAFEDPGYQPVRSIFHDRNFQSVLIPIDRDGILVERLPSNISSTVYVSPSNQFPTGSIMPVARRYALLDWAQRNASLIIEDDYNSELRYDSRPVPSLAGLDEKESVVYLGSFSSTLFASAKISYMILPPSLSAQFQSISADYDQTCSKVEQLALASFMERGFYQANLRRIRKLYAQKRQVASTLLLDLAQGRLRILNNSSGLHMLLELVKRPATKNAATICQIAAAQGLRLAPIFIRPDDAEARAILFYYTRIPLDQMEPAIRQLADLIG